jgi:hypothetical protein
VTGLWDSDGNVFFDVVLLDSGNPTASRCTINAGSRPGTWNPDITVFAQSGVQCEIVATGNDPTTNTFYYDLQLTTSNTADIAPTAAAKSRPGQPAAAVAPQEYAFNIALLDGAPLAVWQAGTLAVQIGGRVARGRLALPGFYKEALELTGRVGAQYGQTGTLVTMTGKNSEIAGELTFLYDFDGFLTSTTFLGGTASILDNNAQETYTYVVQGATAASAAAAPRTPARKPRR